MNRKAPDRLLQYVRTADAGAKDVRRQERMVFLGELRERILCALTFDQVKEPGVYNRVEKDMADSRAKKIVYSRRLPLPQVAPYLNLADKYRLPFTAVDSPFLKGNIALVVSADRAVDRSKIIPSSRSKKLKEAGLPMPLIKAAGKKICSRCLNRIKKKVPAELSNYRKLGYWDRLLGLKCPACKDKKNRKWQQ